MNLSNILLSILKVAGASSLSMGVYIIASDYGAHQLSAVLGDELYHVAAYIAIAGGAAISIISLCGVCGSLKEVKCVLLIVSKRIVYIYVKLTFNFNVINVYK
jgi:hypothetical protein